MLRLFRILFGITPLSARARLGLARRHLATLHHRARLAAQGTYVDASAQILGWDYITFGRKTTIGEGVCINVNHCVKDSIFFGNSCYIGRRCFFSPGASLIIDDYCVLGPECSVIGADHDFSHPETSVLHTGPTKAGDIRIEPNCWLGTKVVVLKNVTIGRGSIIAASSVVTKDIPPFSVAAGIPAMVIKRYNFQLKRWVPVKDFQPCMEDSHPSLEQYEQALRQNSTPGLRAPIQPASALMGEY